MNFLLWLFAVIGAVYTCFVVVAALIESSAIIPISVKNFISYVKHNSEVNDENNKVNAEARKERLKLKRDFNNKRDLEVVKQKIDKKEKQILLEKQTKVEEIFTPLNTTFISGTILEDSDIETPKEVKEEVKTKRKTKVKE